MASRVAGAGLCCSRKDKPNYFFADEAVSAVTTGDIAPALEDVSQVSSSQDELADLPQSSIEFPEHVWDDGHSISSSLGMSKFDDFKTENKYRVAEETSVYDGPDAYRHLSVLANLELYFKFFVFASSGQDVSDSFTGVMPEDDLSRMLLETAPRIQLRPIDRRAVELAYKNRIGGMNGTGLHESFVRVSREDVLECGKPAARRLTPNRVPK